MVYAVLRLINKLMVSKRILLLFFAFLTLNTFAQSDFEKQGMQLLVKGDYKSAVSVLEKAKLKTPDNSNVLKMLGYAYFQTGDNEKAITNYSRLLTLKSDDASAYYYRGKARLNIANNPKNSLNQMREEFYLSSIKDFTRAIELNPENEVQYHQNRGIAYKDLAIFKSFKVKKSSEKAVVVTLFNNSQKDFQKILVSQPLRKDIIDLEKYVKDQIKSLN